MLTLQKRFFWHDIEKIRRLMTYFAYYEKYNDSFTLFDLQFEENWKLRSYNKVEEELFVTSHTVIWSRGGVVMKTYTVDSPVKQVRFPGG